MAAIYKRHLRPEAAKETSGGFAFDQNRFQENPDPQYLTTTEEGTDNTTNVEQVEETHDRSNIFGRIANFTAQIDRSKNNDVEADDVINNNETLSPMWSSHIFSPFSPSVQSLDGEFPNEQPPTISYVVNVSIVDCIMTSVDVTTRSLSDYPIDILSSPAKSDDDESRDSDDSRFLFDEFATAKSDQPISTRLRMRRRHKTGGLFPRYPDVVYDWLDDDSSSSRSDQSESEESSNLPPFAVTSHKAPERDQHEPLTLIIDDVTPDDDKDHVTNSVGVFSPVESDDLKLVLRRNKTHQDKEDQIEKNWEKNEEEKKEQPLRPFVVKATAPTVEVCGTPELHIADILTACNRPQSVANGLSCNLPNNRDQELKASPMKNKRRRSINRRERPTRPPLAANEEKGTELRLAMEFPRHNWLVKHLIKEQKLLKSDDDKCDPLPGDLSPNSHAPEMSSPSPQVSTHEDPAFQQKTSPSPPATQATTRDEQLSSNCVVIEEMRSNSPAGRIASEGSQTILKPFLSPKSPSAEKSTDNSAINVPDEPCSKKRKTVDSPTEPSRDSNPRPSTPEETKNPKKPVASNNNNSKLEMICDVKIGQCFSLADSNPAPLDLSTNRKPSRFESSCVLDLSRGTSKEIAEGVHKDQVQQPEKPITSSYDVTQRGDIPPISTSSSILPNSIQEKTASNNNKIQSNRFGPLAPPTDHPKSHKDVNLVDLYTLVRKRGGEEDKHQWRPGADHKQMANQGPRKAGKEAAMTNGHQHPTQQKLGAKNHQVQVIDVDAIDDNLPVIKPRPTNRAPLPTKGGTPPGFAPQGQRGVPVTSRFPGVVTVTSRDQAYRTKSVDSFPLYRSPHSLGEKPRSAPPSIAAAPGVHVPLRHPLITPPHTHKHPQRLPHVRGQHPLSKPVVELQRPKSSSGNHLRPPSEQFYPLPRAPRPQNHPNYYPSTPVFSQGARVPDTFTHRPQVSVPMLCPSQKPRTDVDGFRVPVKPTPIHYQRVSPQQARLPRPPNAYPTHCAPKAPIPHPLIHRPVYQPRPSVVRAPPGGVSINSTPLNLPQRRHPAYEGMPPIPHKGEDIQFTPNAMKMTHSAAQRFSAQIKEHQKELEEKLSCLRELERKIQPPCFTLQAPNAPNPRKRPAPGQLPFPGTPMSTSGYFPGAQTPPGYDKMRGYPRGNYREPQPQTSPMEEKCVVCGKRAYFVCSGCRGVWYCSKDCQFQDWEKHCNTCL